MKIVMRMVSIYSLNYTNMKNINCVWNAGRLCENTKVKRSFFGIGARKCIEYISCKKCELKQIYPKPKTSSPLPPNSEIITVDGVIMIKIDV